MVITAIILEFCIFPQARLISSYEEQICNCFHGRYRDHIHEKCSPCAKFYDDDEHLNKKTNTDVKKITHQIYVGSTFGVGINLLWCH